MKKAVLFLNFGGPVNTEEVEDFLYQLFSDSDGIKIGIPAFMQKQVAKIISAKRAPSVQEKYDQIGGGSPLVAMSQAILERLEKECPEYPFYIGMRYTTPTIEEAVLQIKRDGIEDVLVIPLYPHYSIATSETSFLELKRAIDFLDAGNISFRLLYQWFDFKPYIKALAERINIGLKEYYDGGTVPSLIFSAHSVPKSYIEEGDPYQKQIQKTVGLLLKELQWTGDWKLCYQSQVGPVAWLGPSMQETLELYSNIKDSNLLVVPLSFVGDHIETLHEVDIEFANLAKDLGIQNFHRSPSLNTEESFMQCLVELVNTYMNIDSVGIGWSRIHK
ncbi:MAG: ferrochelatase [Candidatus Cloacimonadota bacterium]|nr:MAG: ferrochelatase [Candidatus Cloacimonadota bacterium]